MVTSSGCSSLMTSGLCVARMTCVRLEMARRTPILHVVERVNFCVESPQARYVGFWPVRCLAMMRRWIWPVPSKMS
jgi:hypothetical protein